MEGSKGVVLVLPALLSHLGPLSSKLHAQARNVGVFDSAVEFDKQISFVVKG